MCKEFSTESSQKWFAIFVDEGKVTAVLESSSNKGRRYLRDEEDIEKVFSQAAKALAASKTEEFREMQDLIQDDNDFWVLSQKAVLELIRELQALTN